MSVDLNPGSKSFDITNFNFGGGKESKVGGSKGAQDAAEVSPGIQAMLANMPAPEAAIFKTLLANLDPSAMAPDGKPGNDPSLKDLEKLAAVVSNIVAMSVSGDTMNYLARVMIQQQGQERHEAVQDRQNMRQLAMGELMAAAGELNKQADTMQTAAIVNLVMSCVSAGLSIAGSVGSMAKTGQALKELQSGEKGAETLANLTSKQGEAFGGIMGGFGKAFEAAGNFASAEGQVEVKRSEANQKIDEAMAQYLEGQADVKKGVQDGLDEMVKQIISMVKELQDAKAERMQAFTRV